MDILSALDKASVWQEFYAYKESGGHMSHQALQAMDAFIQEEGYLPVVERIRCGSSFAPPRKKELSKLHTEKKRIVYTYSDAENYVLKLLTYLLQQEYDHLFADNLYSFRSRRSARDAIARLIKAPEIRQLWSYKVDIRNYFNSVPVDRLLPLLRKALADQPEICRFLEKLLTDPLVEENGILHPEEKGIMAGTPISTFLANLYLAEMDHHFSGAGVLYARYSDDIIVFGRTQQARNAHAETLMRFLQNAGLGVNPEKEARTGPGEPWIFLGIRYHDGIVDVAPASVEKLKGKMRRKARALARWQARKGATGQQAAKAFIRAFNRKLFENPVAHELTWSRWYFPLLNTHASLQILDAYCQQCIRFLATGKHTKAAYDFRYEDIKALGYISLVNRYYAHIHGNNAQKSQTEYEKI